MTEAISAPHMTPLERDLFEVGHVENYGGFVIKPKRDFGERGFWSAEHGCHLNAGWIACYGSGDYAGCLATPGATFAWTLQGAREMVDDMIAAGGTGRCDAVGGGIDAAKFWLLNRARHEARRAE